MSLKLNFGNGFYGELSCLASTLKVEIYCITVILKQAQTIVVPRAAADLLKDQD